MENWDHKPGEITNDSIEKLMKEKPGATIGNLIHGVPSKELDSEQTELLQQERDQLVLETMRLQIDLEKITGAIPDPHSDAEIEIKKMQENLSKKKEFLLKIETYLAKHGEIK